MSEKNTADVKITKNYVSMDEFAATLNITKPAVSSLRKRGILPNEIITKSGRKHFIHLAKAKDALKKAPMGTRGAIPAWAIAVGNKDALAKQKAMAKAEAKKAA